MHHPTQPEPTTLAGQQPPARLLTAREVAERICVHRDTVYRHAREGELPHYRIGRALRFDIGVVEAHYQG